MDEFLNLKSKNKMYITVVIKNQSLHRTDHNYIVANSNEYLHIQIVRTSPDWENTVRSCILYNSNDLENPIEANTDSFKINETEWKIPSNLITKDGFYLTFVCRGQNNRTITTNKIFIRVDEAGYEPGSMDEDRNPSKYEMLMDQMKELSEEGKQFAEKAEQEATNAANSASEAHKTAEDLVVTADEKIGDMRKIKLSVEDLANQAKKSADNAKASENASNNILSNVTGLQTKINETYEQLQEYTQQSKQDIESVCKSTQQYHDIVVEKADIVESNKNIIIEKTESAIQSANEAKLYADKARNSAEDARNTTDELIDISTQKITDMETIQTDVTTKHGDVIIKHDEVKADRAEVLTNTQAAIEARESSEFYYGKIVDWTGTRIAPLENGKVPIKYVPALATVEHVEIQNADDLITLTSEQVQRGDMADIIGMIETDTGTQKAVIQSYWLLGDGDPSNRDNWIMLATTQAAQAGHAKTAEYAENASKINGYTFEFLSQNDYERINIPIPKTIIWAGDFDELE